jgi:hypothetical protein
VYYKIALPKLSHNPLTADVTLPSASDWDHVHMIPKDTLVIYHARIMSPPSAISMTECPADRLIFWCGGNGNHAALLVIQNCSCNTNNRIIWCLPCAVRNRPIHPGNTFVPSVRWKNHKRGSLRCNGRRPCVAPTTTNDPYPRMTTMTMTLPMRMVS